MFFVTHEKHFNVAAGVVFCFSRTAYAIFKMFRMYFETQKPLYWKIK